MLLIIYGAWFGFWFSSTHITVNFNILNAFTFFCYMFSNCDIINIINMVICYISNYSTFAIITMNIFKYYVFTYISNINRSIIINTEFI